MMRMNKKFLLIVILFLAFAGCKRIMVGSEVSTLENLAAGSEIHVNVCAGDPQKAAAYAHLIPPVTIEVNDENLKTTLGDSAIAVMTALPEEYLHIANAVNAKVIVTNAVDQLCSGRTDAEQQRILKDPATPLVEACYINAMDAQNSPIAGMNIVVAANADAIMKWLLQTFGYMISDVGGYGFNFGTVGNAPRAEEYFVLENQLVASFLHDMNSSRVFAISPTFDQLLGANAGAVIRSNINARQHGQKRGLMEGLATTEVSKKSFFAHVVANAIDSAYCMATPDAPYDDQLAKSILASADTSRFNELKNTNKIMRDFFPETSKSFVKIDEHLKRVGRILASVNPRVHQAQAEQQKTTSLALAGEFYPPDTKNNGFWYETQPGQHYSNLGLQKILTSKIGDLNRAYEQAPSSVPFYRKSFLPGGQRTKQEVQSEIYGIQSSPAYIRIKQELATEARQRKISDGSMTIPTNFDSNISKPAWVGNEAFGDELMVGGAALGDKVYNTGVGFSELPGKWLNSSKQNGFIPTLRDGVAHAYDQWTTNINSNYNNRLANNQNFMRAGAMSVYDNFPIVGQSLQGINQNMGLLFDSDVYNYNKTANPYTGQDAMTEARDTAMDGAMKNIEAAAFGKAVGVAGSSVTRAAPLLSRIPGSATLIGGMSSVPRALSTYTAPVTSQLPSFGPASQALGSYMAAKIPGASAAMNTFNAFAPKGAISSLKHQATHFVGEGVGEARNVVIHHAATGPAHGEGGHEGGGESMGHGTVDEQPHAE